MAPDKSPPLDFTHCPLHELNPLDPELNQEPHGYFHRLREEAPVFRDAFLGMVHVSRYDDILEVLRQHQIFSSEWGGVGAQALGVELLPEEEELMKLDRSQRPTLLTRDPPAHTRFKKLAIKGFTRKRVEQMSDYMAQVIEELIDSFIDNGHCEFKTAFADNLPSILISDAVGVDRNMLPQWHNWLHNAIKRFDLHRLTREERIESAKLSMEMNEYMLSQIQQKRRNPGEDILSDLIQATLVEEGDPRGLDDAELLSMFGQIFVAGQETTAHSLTAGLYYLITNPHQMEKIRINPDLIVNFVEETLRYLTPVNNMFRKVKVDTVLNGVELKAGDMIMLKYGSGNHDERHFPDAEHFDVTRKNARDHLAFGMGVHFCLGSELARREIALSFRAILSKMKNIRLAEGSGPIRYTPNHLLRGVAELNIEFDRA